MKTFVTGSLLALISLGVPAVAGTGTPGSPCLSGHYSMRGDVVDSYAGFLPNDLNMESFELSRSYSIELKSFRVDENQYQFRAVDNRGLGAGYSSPYLWDVGRGPGAAMPSRNWQAPMDGRAYSPIPMLGR